MPPSDPVPNDTSLIPRSSPHCSSHNGFRAWVKIDGEKVPVYPNSYHMNLGFIESIEGKEFTIGVRDGLVRQASEKDFDMMIEYHIDGVW